MIAVAAAADFPVRCGTPVDRNALFLTSTAKSLSVKFSKYSPSELGTDPSWAQILAHRSLLQYLDEQCRDYNAVGPLILPACDAAKT